MSVPIQHQPTWRRAAKAWFDPRGNEAGLVAFALNRLTGLGLVVYLFMHLVVLSTLTQGQEAYDAFVALAKTPLFKLLDVVLFTGFVYHMLNGVRVTLIGLGIGDRHQKAMWWATMAILAAAMVFVTYELFLA
jgi:succinate dehydrogenase / fumarate reductase cytochrome b subunit